MLKFDLQSNIIKRYGLAVMHTFNIGTPRQKQEDLCEFQGSLVYILSSKIAGATQRDLVPNKNNNHNNAKKEVKGVIILSLLSWIEQIQQDLLVFLPCEGTDKETSLDTNSDGDIILAFLRCKNIISTVYGLPILRQIVKVVQMNYESVYHYCQLYLTLYSFSHTLDSLIT